jgi:hypothetical protein
MKLLSILPLFLCACGSPVIPEPTATDKVSATVESLKANVFTNDVIGFCSDNGDGQCDDGDSTIRNGQLCFSGELQYCDYVKNAVGADGRIWRSPARVDNTWEVSETASRDQLLGVLMYLAKTHDTELAMRVLNYIQANHNSVCPISDGRCKVSNLGFMGPMWGTMRIVWNHLGLTPTYEMQASNAGDEATIWGSASGVPVNYQLHLLANQILVYMHCDVYTNTLKLAADRIASRDPDNLFYAWLAGQDVTEKFLTFAPKTFGLKQKWSFQNPMNEYSETTDNVGSWLMLGDLILKGVK